MCCRLLGVLVVALLAAFQPFSLEAQQRRRADASETMRRIRAEGMAGPLSPILRSQGGWERTAAGRDSLADSLVAFVVNWRPDGRVSRETAEAIQRSLIDAIIEDGPGVPYLRAADGLVKIALEGPTEFRGGSVMALALMSNKGMALEHLERIAIDEHLIAGMAVQVLALELGPAGLAVLQRLYRADQVKNAQARAALESFAASQRWPKPPGGAR